MDELAVEFDGRAKVVKANTDDNFEVASSYGIRMLPNLLLFKDGEVVEQRIGRQTKESLGQLLTSKL